MLAVALGVVLLGCGGGGEVSDRLEAEGAWSRPTPAGADEGVVYLTVTSDRDDAVVEASVPADVAESAQLHQTMVGGSGGAHHHGGGGSADGDTVSMGEAERLPVAPGEPLVFEPGGNHVMLTGLRRPLVAGQRFVLRLRLATGRSVEAPVTVSVNPPG